MNPTWAAVWQKIIDWSKIIGKFLLKICKKVITKLSPIVARLWKKFLKFLFPRSVGGFPTRWIYIVAILIAVYELHSLFSGVSLPHVGNLIHRPDYVIDLSDVPWQKVVGICAILLVIIILAVVLVKIFWKRPAVAPATPPPAKVKAKQPLLFRLLLLAFIALLVVVSVFIIFQTYLFVKHDRYDTPVMTDNMLHSNSRMSVSPHPEYITITPGHSWKFTVGQRPYTYCQGDGSKYWFKGNYGQNQFVYKDLYDGCWLISSKESDEITMYDYDPDKIDK